MILNRIWYTNKPNVILFLFLFKHKTNTNANIIILYKTIFKLPYAYIRVYVKKFGFRKKFDLGMKRHCSSKAIAQDVWLL